MAVDSNIGSLPAAASIEDDSLLVAEQQGEAKHITGKQLKDYAKQGVDALVTAAQKAADDAAQAARDAQAAADSVQDVSADAAAAKAAAQAAENARAAAVQAAQYADNAAALAAQNAVADVGNLLQGYVDDAQSAKNAAETAADNAAANVDEILKGYVSDAQTAKNAAEQAAENAAAEAVQQVESQLEDYVSDAEQAKEDAQSAAGTAAQDAVSAANAQLADYVSAAQAAQKAAEDARDQAQAIAGGNFLPTAGGTMTGPITLAGDPVEDLHAATKQYVDEKLKDVDNIDPEKLSSPVPINKGGTGAASAEDARENLDVYSKEETEKKIADINAVERNLVLDSGREITSKNGNIVNFYISPSEGGVLTRGDGAHVGYLVAGEQYTVTLDVTPADDFAYFRMYVSGAVELLAYLYPDGTTNRQTITKTFTAKYSGTTTPSAGEAMAWLFQYSAGDGSVTTDTTIHNIKIVRGSKSAVGWTPAPEDMLAKTGGKLTGALIATADSTPTVAKLRNTALFATDTNATVNGEINWTFG